MTLEEKFAEMFPEYVAGSKLLSPYWDLFEAGAEVNEGEFEKSLLEKGVCLQSDLDEAKGIIAMQKRALENYILSPDETIKNLIRKAEALLKGE